MTSIKNRPGTLRVPRQSVLLAPILPHLSGVVKCRQTSDELIEDEVLDFLSKPYQSEYDPKGVARFLLGRINNRLISENTTNELKGQRAHRLLKALPPAVIATCILHRELRHTGLIGKSEETAELVTYEDAGLDEGLYVPADQHIRRLARQYHYTISPKDLNAVVECVRDSVPLLEESKGKNVVALANGLFDLDSKELLPFSPDVVLRSKASVAFHADATTCPVMDDGWNVDEWIMGLANNDTEVEKLYWQIIAALFRLITRQ